MPQNPGIQQTKGQRLLVKSIFPHLKNQHVSPNLKTQIPNSRPEILFKK